MNKNLLTKYQLEFKDAKLNDLNNMIDMYIETFNSEPWNDKWTKETAYRRLHAMINVEDFYGLCAYKDNQICGVIIGCKEEFYDRTIFNLREFFVNNSLRGHGIGTRMIGELDKRLKAQGVKEITLYTIRNIMTEGFYKKCGFTTYDSMVVMGKNLN